MARLRFPIALCLATLLFAPSRSAAVAHELDRYVGNYTFLFRNVTLRVVRDGDRLIARPSNNMPSATLAPQSEPGRFSVVGAWFEFQFLTDASARVLGIEMTEPNGTKHTFSRLFDARAAAAPLRAVAVDAETSVNARVYNGYERTKGADGRFKTETYAFGEGGFQDTAGMSDPSIDDITFEALVRSLAPAFAQQGYFCSADVENLDLLVMVYWGSTASDDHPAVLAEESFDPTSHQFRDQLNRTNARVLGFSDAMRTASDVPGLSNSRKKDLLFDLEESRYWIALVAVDFRLVRTEKKLKPLWSIRYNMRSRGTNFREALPQMTQFASNFFGRDSHGLINRSIREKQGKVELGEAKVLGIETAR